MKYCHTCDWSVSAADGTKHERSQQAIGHFVETGHPIDSTNSAFRPRSPPAAGKILQRTLLDRVVAEPFNKEG